MIDHTNWGRAIFSVHDRYIEDGDELGSTAYFHYLACILAYQYIHKDLSVPMEELIERADQNVRRDREGR